MLVIGHKLKAQRKILGLKSHEVAKAIGMQNHNYSRIENGINMPRIKRLREICKVLNLDGYLNPIKDKQKLVEGRE